MTAPERKCEDCGLPISICNARAMVGVAVKRNGAAEVAKHMGLPPTMEQAKALPEIKALVEAAEYILDGMGIDAPLYEIDPDDDFLDAANSEWVSDTLRMLATALRAIGEGGE